MSLTIVVIVITVLISYQAFNNPHLSERLIMSPVAVRQGQWYRMVSSGFIHSNWMHLGFNMFTLFFFGRNVEYIFQWKHGYVMGSVYFIVFYILAIVASDLVTVWKHKDHPYYRSLGASGGVSAIVFCSILFVPTEDICLYGFLCIPGFILGTFYIIYSYMKSDTFSDNINHDAHLYGAIFGFLFGIFIDPGALPRFFEQVLAWRPFG